MANATIFANTAVQECTAKILRMNNSPIPIPMQSLPKKFFLPTISPLFVSTSGYVNWSRKRNQVDVRRRRCFSCVVPYCELALVRFVSILALQIKEELVEPNHNTSSLSLNEQGCSDDDVI